MFMAENKDVRWLQRYDSFKKALEKLKKLSTLSGRCPSDLSELEQSGLVLMFEFCLLSWLGKVMQDILEYKGYEFIPWS